MNFDRNVNLIEKKIGYTFSDRSLLRQAFTRGSYTNEHRPSKTEVYQSNEVLEFFGDSVLSLAIVTLIIRDCAQRYEYGIKTRLNEGDFSNVKSNLSDKKNLSDRMRSLGLAEYLIMGEGDVKNGVKDEPSVMEDLFESIIGAVYIDSGNSLDAVMRVVSSMLCVGDYLKRDHAPLQSYKNALQEWCADRSRRLPAPVYKTVSESGPDHRRVFERACFIGERQYAVGVGKNQKLADSDAAEKTLAILMEEEQSKKEKNARESADKRGAAERLVEYLRSQGMQSPRYYDLGETPDSTPNRPKFRVECRIADSSAVGEGVSKSDARNDASDKMLKSLKESARRKSKATPKKSSGGKKK